MGHKSTEKCVNKSDGYITFKNQAHERKKTTKGWELLIELADVIIT